MRAHPLRQQKVGRDDAPAADSRVRGALRGRLHHRHHDRWVGLLVRTDHQALADLRDHRPLGRDAPVLPREVVRRRTGPDPENRVHALVELLAPIEIEIPEHLPVRRQPTGADAEDEPSLEHVVEHRDLRRDRSRMAVREIDRPGAKLDLLGHRSEAGEKDDRVGDRLCHVGHVLADERLGETELVREHDRVAVLLQRLHIIAPHGMQGHREIAEIHPRASNTRREQSANAPRPRLPPRPPREPAEDHGRSKHAQPDRVLAGREYDARNGQHDGRVGGEPPGVAGVAATTAHGELPCRSRRTTGA